MIDEVTFEKTTYADLPNKFEPGTPNIAGVIASGVALDYINGIGLEKIKKYEDELLAYATEKLKEINGVKIYGESENKTSVISFNIGDIHPYDIGSVIDLCATDAPLLYELSLRHQGSRKQTKYVRQGRVACRFGNEFEWHEKAP